MPEPAPPAPSDVDVVVVHWDQPERLAEALASLRDQRRVRRVVVVDNDSAPACRARLDEVVAAGRADGQAVEVLDAGRNAGFGGGANVGLRALLGGDAPLLALCPHDALVAPGALDRLAAHAEHHPRAGLVSADVGLGLAPHVDHRLGAFMVPGAGEGWEEVDYPHGTLLVARRACLEDVGLFDERYFAYCEEADLGLRARRAGWRVDLVWGARVTNPGMRSGGTTIDYLWHRNTVLLLLDHFGRWAAVVRWVIGAWQLARGLVQPSFRRRSWVFDARGRARGLRDAALGRWGPPPFSAS